MKKIAHLFLLSLFALTGLSQDIDHSIAMKIVDRNSKKIGLTADELKNIIISSAYFNESSGTELVYIQQSYKGLPVFNQIQSLAFKNGQLVSATGTRIKNIEKLVKLVNETPSIKAETAVKRAMDEKKISSKLALIANPIDPGKKIDFGKMDFSSESITAELMWLPINGAKEVRLVWQVYLVPAKTLDYWLVRVDANNNQILEETNLTVYCNFDADKNHTHSLSDKIANNNFNQKSNALVFSPTIVNGASYRVVPYPAESPIHPGGTPNLISNPWTLAPGNATSLKWHSDGTTDYSITRGNNVWATEDRDANNSTTGLPATSTTSPDPLTFDFVPNFTITPTQTTPVQNQQFNTTNLFYWNNIIHDLVYQYGFTEAAGNFQSNNQGRGGAGNDFVIADAQDGGGTNNANFSTPADGGNGRMQMYLWNGNPQKDGDVDNGIIVHEFSHGISSRLTGGPAQAGCLGNEEQMGEGWSDYFALMATQNWASATLNDGFNNPRGIGTYATGQSITGSGIRPRKYTSNMGINEMTYANLPSQAIPHGVGFIWCTMLWDMTWEIIQQAGINPNLFDASATGGNSIALKLVTEAMKLQPCSPGFIDGRNAILQADQLLYGGQYRCAIISAFARRGLGFDAKQGSSASRSDGTAGFSAIETTLTLTQNLTQQLEGQNVTYNNHVTAGICSGITNYLLTDTLPSNVTYVTGGTYNAGTRVVSFNVNIAAGQAQDYSFTVKINNGSWFPTVNLLDEQVTGAVIPPTWVTSSINSSNFTVSSAQSHSAPNSFFGINAVTASDFRIATTSAVAMGTTPPVLSFWHNYNTEDGWDGGLVEISINGGATWNDLGSNMILNGYNGNMGTGSNNPLGGRAAFTGNSNGFIKTIVSLSPYANQNALFRFRVGSDDNTAIAGWYIDDILLQSKAVVNMRSSLFNAAGSRINISDTVTTILENAACIPAGITAQPANSSACAGSNTSFSVIATGTNLNYQWQLSSDNGLNYSNISGATTATLELSAISAAMNNNYYRVVITNACPSAITSAAAILTVSNTATIVSQPVNAIVCLNGNTFFTTTASGSNLSYQWQVSTDAGISFTNIAGATSSLLNLTGVTSSMNSNQYRVIVFSCGPIGTNSNAAILSITNPANIISKPTDVIVCPNDNVSFLININGNNLTYQWQVKTIGNTSFNNIPGAINTTLNLSTVNLAQNGNQYRVIINGECTVDLTSTAATLNVNTPVTITQQPSGIAGCAGSTVNFNVAANGTSISYQWQLSVNGGAFVNLVNNNQYSGVSNNNLIVAGINTSMNGYAYRVIVTGPPCGAVISNIASLIAYPLPGVVLVAAEYNNITPSIPTSLFSTVSPVGTYTYQWFKNGALLNGANNSSYPVDVDKLGTYSVTATDANGCSVISNLVKVSDSISNQLFIYPNPNNGQFQVRYYNPGISQNRILIIYDAKGSKVYSKQYTIGGTYDRMDVILTNVQSGVYTVDLRDSMGNRLAAGSLIIQ